LLQLSGKVYGIFIGYSAVKVAEKLINAVSYLEKDRQSSKLHTVFDGV